MVPEKVTRMPWNIRGWSFVGEQTESEIVLPTEKENKKGRPKGCKDKQKFANRGRPKKIKQ